jgi:hypothetical protein
MAMTSSLGQRLHTGIYRRSERMLSSVDTGKFIDSRLPGVSRSWLIVTPRLGIAQRIVTKRILDFFYASLSSMAIFVASR